MLHTPRAILREFLTVYWRKIFSQLSSTRARTNRVADKGLRLLLTLVLLNAGIPGWAEEAVIQKTVVFNISQQRADAALTEFAEQADLTLMFPPELVEDISTNELIGRYTPKEGAEILLVGTGLIPTFSTEVVLSISTDDRSVGEGDTMKTKRKAGLVALLAGVFTGGVGAQEANMSTEMVAQTSVITGKVTDVRTGANLKGALVTIMETGQTTSSNDLGEYRFPIVTTGVRTLQVTYLGYGAYSEQVVVAGEDLVRNLQLESMFDEIVVLGARSGRMQALNQERTAPNTMTVLNADQLGTFNGTTISEALRRAPGIAFIPDENTGEGARVIVRGLGPDFNQVTLNGVRLLDGTGLGRSPDLSNLLTESIESVTINKSLLPSQDSNGAGALIEIETKSPLDRDERFASFTTEYGENGGDFGREFGVGGTLSGIFGRNRDWGASISTSYREREVTRLRYDFGSGGVNPEALPLDENGVPVEENTSSIDPRRLFPFEPELTHLYPSFLNVSQGSSDTETLSITTSLQKRFGNHTDLRFDIVFNDEVTERFNTSTSAFASSTYIPQPVESLGGEVRAVRVGENIGAGLDPFFEFIFGPGIPGDINRMAEYSPSSSNSSLSFSLDGSTELNNWDFEYRAGYNKSETDTDHVYSLSLGDQAFGQTGLFNALIDRNFLSEEALGNTTSDGRIISVFPALSENDGDQFILPLFSEAGFEFYNNADSFPVSLGVFAPRGSEGEEFSYSGSARYSFVSGFAEYVELGVDVRQASFLSPGDIGRVDLGRLTLSNATGITTSELGLGFGPGLLEEVGAESDLAALSRAGVEAFVASIDELVANGSLVEGSENLANQNTFRETDEDTYAFYLQSQLNLGPFELIGGARFEQVDISATFLSAPSVFDENGQRRVVASDVQELVTDSASQSNVLPRVLANYRFNENVIFRGAYYVTVSRPQLANISARQQMVLRLDPSRSSTQDRPLLQVSQGNPDLRPATAHNFGLDWEWYDDNVGVIKVAGFYKLIEDPLQSNAVLGGIEVLPEELTLPDISFFNNLPDPLEVLVSQPVNDDEEHEIWGVELTAERQFSLLPGAFGGLGVYANYAYTDSSSTQRVSVGTSVDPRGFVEFDDVPFEDSPEHQYTVGLTYGKYGVDASLMYTHQDRRLSSIGRFGLDNYEESIETLDFRLDYLFELFGSNVRAFVRAEDLLSDDQDPFLQTSVGGENGVPKYFTGGTYYGGRSFFGGISVIF